MEARPNYPVPSGDPSVGANPQQAGYGIPPAEDPTFSPLNFLQIVRRYLWLWIPLTIAGGLGGYVYQTTRTPIHMASARVMVDRRQNNPAMDSMAMFAGAASPLDHIMLNHMELIRSPAVLEAAARDAKLVPLRTFHGKQIGPAIQAGIDVRRPRMADNTVVPSILEITYRCENREDSPIVLESVVKAYRDYVNRSEETNSTQLMTNAGDARNKLEKDLRELQDAHNKLLALPGNQDYAAFRDARNDISCPERERLTKSEFELNQAERSLAGVKAQRDSLLKMLADAAASKDPVKIREAQTTVEMIAGRQAVEEAEQQHQEALALLQQRQAEAARIRFPEKPQSVVNRDEQLLGIRVRLAELKDRLGPEHSEVKSTQNLIATLEDANAKDMVVHRKMVADAEADADAAARARAAAAKAPALPPKPKKPPADIVAAYMQTLEVREQQFKKQISYETGEIAKLQPIVKKTAALANEDKDLRQRIDEKQKTLSQFVARLDNMAMSQKDGGIRVQEIQPPIGVGDPTGALVRAMVLGSLLGFLAGLACCYLLELLDQNFRTPDDVRDVVGARVLGHIPDFTGKVRRLGRRHGVDPTLITHLDRSDPASEAYRRLRTGLYFSQHRRELEVLQVTSPVPGDGKTTVSCNLAVAIAQSGKRVLLIDADLRRPRVHRMFGMPNEVGLANVLSGSRRNEAEAFAAAHATMTFREALAVVGKSRPAGNVRVVLAYPAMLDANEPKLIAYGVQADDRMAQGDRKVYRFEVDLRKPADEQPKLTPTIEKETDRAKFLRGLPPAAVVEHERRVFGAAELHASERVTEAGVTIRGGRMLSRLYGLRGRQAAVLPLDEAETASWEWRDSDLFEESLCDLGAAIPDLAIMTAGRTQRQNAAELLTDHAFVEVLARARAEYEFVIVDTPPLLAVSDPAVVAPRVDGVLLALSLHGQARRNAIDAMEALRHIKCDLIGSVINCKGGGAMSYGGRFYGRYSYQLGSRGNHFNSGRPDSYGAGDYSSYYRQYTKAEKERKS